MLGGGGLGPSWNDQAGAEKGVGWACAWKCAPLGLRVGRWHPARVRAAR